MIVHRRMTQPLTAAPRAMRRITGLEASGLTVCRAALVFADSDIR
jgi:hypothetical protein